MSKAHNIKVYDQNAIGMAQKFNNIGVRSKDIDRIFSYLKGDNPFVFEIGCGNGRDAHGFLNKTNNYLGIDYSKGMLKIAKKRLPRGKFELADFAKYDYPDKTDAIVGFAALVHSSKFEVKKVLEKSLESLNEGGIFFLSFKLGKYKKFIKTDEFGSRTFYSYTPGDIEELAQGKLKVVYKHECELRGKKWFEIILQKWKK